MFIELHTTDGCRLLVNPKEIQMLTEDSYGVTEVTLKGRSSIDVSETYDEVKTKIFSSNREYGKWKG